MKGLTIFDEHRVFRDCLNLTICSTPSASYLILIIFSVAILILVETDPRLPIVTFSKAFWWNKIFIDRSVAIIALYEL